MSADGPQVTAVAGAKLRGTLLRAALWLVGLAALGFVTTWAFLGYLQPGMVLDFATLLQMCGIPLSR